MSQTKTTSKFCFSFFGKNKVCNGCSYRHDIDAYLEANGLKHCPNCENFCKETSKSCSKCVTEWLKKKSPPTLGDVVVTKFCVSYFGKEKACDDEDCKDSHDLSAFLKVNGLKQCPNTCGNFCKEASTSCTKCVTEWLANKEKKKKDWEDKQTAWTEERAEWDAKPLQKCSGIGCKNITKGAFCKECYNINQTYIVRH